MINLNTIIQQDCIEFMKTLPNECIDLVFADPPYFASGTKKGWEEKRFKGIDENWDYLNGKDIDEFNTAWLTECRRILKNEGTIWVCGTFHNIYSVGHCLSNLGFTIINDIILFKPNAFPDISQRKFTSSHENLIWAKKEKTSKYFFDYKKAKLSASEIDLLKIEGSQMRSVWGIPFKISESVDHPSQKSLSLLKRIVELCSKPGDLIFDPFIGSGTTAVAAKMLGRKWLGCELEQKYLDITNKRLSGTQTMLFI